MIEEGFYFVKYNGQWGIAELTMEGNGKVWLRTGIEKWYREYEFDEIGQKIQLPQ